MKFIIDGEWSSPPRKPPVKGAKLERLVARHRTYLSCYEDGYVPGPPTGFGEVLQNHGTETDHKGDWQVYTVRYNPTWTIEVRDIPHLLEIMESLDFTMIEKSGIEGYWSIEPYSH